MADPFLHDHLVDPLTQHEAEAVKDDIDSITQDRPLAAVLLALAWAFKDACAAGDADPSAALDQLLDVKRAVVPAPHALVSRILGDHPQNG